MTEQEKKAKRARNKNWAILGVVAGTIAFVIGMFHVISQGHKVNILFVFQAMLGAFGACTGGYCLATLDHKEYHRCGRCERKMFEGEIVLVDKDDPYRLLCKHCQEASS